MSKCVVSVIYHHEFSLYFYFLELEIEKMKRRIHFGLVFKFDSVFLLIEKKTTCWRLSWQVCHTRRREINLTDE